MRVFFWIFFAWACLATFFTVDCVFGDYEVEEVTPLEVSFRGDRALFTWDGEGRTDLKHGLSGTVLSTGSWKRWEKEGGGIGKKLRLVFRTGWITGQHYFCIGRK